MMAAKLEWKEHGQGNWEAKGRDGASIFVRGNGTFDAWIDGHGLEGAATFAEAVKYCQEVEDAAAPPAELPKPGDVYEVPGRKETRRFVVSHTGDGVVTYADLEDECQVGERSWQSWVRDTGAVRIDGEGARVKELESDISHAVANAKKYAPDYPWTLNTASEAVWALGEGRNGVIQACDDWAARVAALEAENAELLEALRHIKSNGDQAGGSLDYVYDIAREAIQREEGGRGTTPPP